MKEKQLKLFYDRHNKVEETSRRRHMLTIPIDTSILMGIIMLFVIIMSFSLGVRQGRKISAASTKIKIARYETNNTDINKVITGAIISDNHSNTEKEDSGNQNKNRNTTNENNKEYIIQLASYLKENLAKKEKQYLKDEGFSAEISKKGEYIVLYVGKFNTKKDAEKIKTSLKKRYSDCFIRRL